MEFPFSLLFFQLTKINQEDLPYVALLFYFFLHRVFRTSDDPVLHHT